MNIYILCFVITFLYIINVLKIRYRLIRIVDGDTIVVKNCLNYRTYKVRLILINAPESKNSLYKKEEPYGKEAKRWLEQCLPKNCILRFEFDKQKTDKFNRILAYVYYDNIMINEKMVREGYAQYAEYRPNIKYSKRILKAEIIAKKLKKGIWKNKKFSF